MLVPVVSLPIVAVPAVSPLKRSAAQSKTDKDRGRRRQAAGRFELEDRRERPSGDPAAAMSSASVLSALLDLPRGG
ncbi:hypothetical protein [Lichenibacterium ramalinae]|uniref:Uncharacterized protein n=1 Tax=Lichenibacterium ramalinae TaxID=2316527 RepID=A0A4Q2RA33_9HYPH|nr:hypothetical protein [Lichenibacterium ramalinae]RYB03601.1 hypothetical protein D3272_15735 [Lichenibacterium ramalinae]